MDSNLEAIVGGHQKVLIVGMQWGDEGKGKIVDSLAPYFDYIVRFQGGANAGHTVVTDGTTYKLHLIPSGIVQGRRSVIAEGVAVNPSSLVKEIEGLERNGIDVNGNLFVSLDARVLMPYHIDQDVAKENADKGIGTTKNGIGPFYEDRERGLALKIEEALQEPEDPAIKEKWRSIYSHKIDEIKSIDPNYKPGDFETLFEEVTTSVRELERRGVLANTSALLFTAIKKGERILFEGAQGVLLCKDHGTKPYVTNSHSCGCKLGFDVGLTDNLLQDVHRIGVAKAYTTRVGQGPFPTEITGELADLIIKRGHEIGTTTGRRRRVGWIDTVGLRYSRDVTRVNEMVITKGDVLAGIPELKIATAYNLNGTTMDLFDFSDASRVARAVPNYVMVNGFEYVADDKGKLSKEFEDYVGTVRDLTKVPVRLVTNGADRSKFIVL